MMAKVSEEVCIVSATPRTERTKTPPCTRQPVRRAKRLTIVGKAWINERVMLSRATLIGAAVLTAACATLPASARPVRTGHHISMDRGHVASAARIRINHSAASRTAPLRWPVHFDDQFVLDP
jgi:hypothetical protein